MVRRIDKYEIVWNDGYTEVIDAAQVSWPKNYERLMGSDVTNKIHFHSYVSDVWTLILAANEEDLRSVRNLTYWTPTS